MSSELRALHRQQLFHWTGGDIEEKQVGREATAEFYIERLHKTLNPQRGLWVKVPTGGDGKPKEALQLNGVQYPLLTPIVCFTEWNLGASKPHTSKYGHLGFGFPRRWVLERGGQPVTYFRAAKTSPFLRAIADLLARYGEPAGQGRLPPSMDFLLHFAKPVSDFREKRDRKAKSGSKRVNTERIRDAFARNAGSPMKFVAEREWRIVHHQSKRFVKNLGEEPTAYFLPFKPGKELFTLVVPDNYIMNRVMRNPDLTNLLFPENGPHVTVLSWQDIGTF